MLRKVLIVEDDEMNRVMLGRILGGSCETLEACNGREAVEILTSRGSDISAVLLDLAMPVMNGYEVLEWMKDTPEFSSIPVLVCTGSTDAGTEVKALKLGANDFITKPYKPEVIRQRLWNAIHLRETTVIAYTAMRDRLTGLYNREGFFVKAAEMIVLQKPGYYTISCFDIDNFKVINDQYGSPKGDEVLKSIAMKFRSDFEPVGGICCRLMADNFAVLFPSSFLDTERDAKIIQDAQCFEGVAMPISFSVGRYLIEDTSLPVSIMCDRAVIAKNKVKGRYDVRVAQYDESMRERILREQRIVTEMSGALQTGEFEVWFQPQYNHSTGALIGSEALVRWRHPERGLVSPGEFIPVFERNGFIYELDKYVWEQVCVLLRKWIIAGRSPLPVSVNISRYDLFRADLTDTIKRFTRKYHIPASLLRLEITESAFTKSADQVISVVKRLMEAGFTVEIDDFGSGYSSLNTLKDVPANVLKLDMKFLESSGNSSRGGNILESIVRMTKWIGMSVIAEGVETQEQADFLESIGCSYVQGYLYARPMPTAEFEQLALNIAKEEKQLALETVESFDNNSFWDPKSIDSLIFNSYIGGACIFEYLNGGVELLRANRKFARVISGSLTLAEVLRIAWGRHLDRENRLILSSAIEQARSNAEEVTAEVAYFKISGCPEKLYLRSTFRVIASAGKRCLVYCTVENTTAQRCAEQKAAQSAEQMKMIMNNVNGGVTAVVLKEGRPNFLFANDHFFAMLGYTREQYKKNMQDGYSNIHAADRSRVIRQTQLASLTRQPVTITYRVVRRDGEIRWIQSNISIANFNGIDEPVQLSVANDVTSLREAERKELETAERMQTIMDNVDCGITAVAMGEKIRYLFSNDKYYELLGYTREQYAQEVRDPFITIHPDDRALVHEKVREANRSGRSVTIEYRVVQRGGKQLWLKNIISTTSFEGEPDPVQLGIFTDITAEKEAEELLRLKDKETELILSQMRKMILLYDVASRTLTLPQSYAKRHGLPLLLEDMPRSFLDKNIISSEDRDSMTAFYDAIQRGEKDCSVKIHIARPDGSVVYEEAQSTTIFDSRGLPSKAVICVEQLNDGTVSEKN